MQQFLEISNKFLPNTTWITIMVPVSYLTRLFTNNVDASAIWNIFIFRGSSGHWQVFIIIQVFRDWLRFTKWSCANNPLSSRIFKITTIRLFVCTMVASRTRIITLVAICLPTIALWTWVRNICWVGNWSWMTEASCEILTTWEVNWLGKVSRDIVLVATWIICFESVRLT